METYQIHLTIIIGFLTVGGYFFFGQEWYKSPVFVRIGRVVVSGITLLGLIISLIYIVVSQPFFRAYKRLHHGKKI